MIRLFELRTEKGLSQREAARIMNVSQGTYNNWENGKTQPSIEQLIALAAFFSVSVDYLIGNTDEYGTVRAGESISSEEREILKLFRALPEASKAPFMEFLKKIQ
ncbi:MAG: helix-turn-helix transcriptional regulator [Clostridia bacterium]|nr:helix-turn-helix transcriptional regulator [Clostridia bacterium]